MILILGVHGINTSPTDDYGARWQQALALRNVRAAVVEARWRSTGTIGGDIAKVMFNWSFRDEQIHILKERLWDFWAESRRQCHKSIVVAHSMGQPLILAAERELRIEGRPTMLEYVTIGGPLSHPIWGSGLGVVGLGRPTAQTPIAFWNKDDGVSALKSGWVQPPSWMDNRRIAIPGEIGFVVEHDATLYLSNPNVSRAIEEHAYECRYE